MSVELAFAYAELGDTCSAWSRRTVIRVVICVLISAALGGGLAPRAVAQTDPKIAVDWSTVTSVSRTSPSLEVDVVPQMRREHPLHKKIFGALRDLELDYVRFLAWYPPVRLVVPALEAPRQGKTSWDFTLVDPIVIDFMDATAGHPVVMDFATTPQWMFKTEKHHYPDTADGLDWQYNEGTELRDPTMQEIADYHARLVSWYTKGGFEDEYGKWHRSGHDYKLEYWEVLNEIELEHKLSPQVYTKLYDAVVLAVRKVSPEMKFVGLSLARTKDPEFFEYFLNPKNHQPGIPLDMISYHFYAVPDPEQSADAKQYSLFDQAEGFLTTVRYIEATRKRLSPQTRTYVDELGVILPEAATGPRITKPIADSYWNLYAAYWTYVYVNLANLGIDLVAGNQFFGYPGFFAGTTMLDWETGAPKACYWVLELMRDTIGPGDKLVDTRLTFPDARVPNVYAQAVVSRKGERKIVLINKRDREFKIAIPGGAGARVEIVDQTTAAGPPSRIELKDGDLTLRGFAVAVVTLAAASP